MTKYLYCGQTVSSNIAIPELQSVESSKGEISFNVLTPQLQSMDLSWPRYWSSPDGEKIIFYKKEGFLHWLRYPGLADFCILENTKEIYCYPLPETPDQTIRHLLLDQVLPRCLAHQGKLMLHASAVYLESGVLIFVGNSGAGKSTLAGSFHQTGQQVISDDCLWVQEIEGRIFSLPSYEGLRLWEDSMAVLFAASQNTSSVAHYSTKKRISLSGNSKFRKNHQILSIIVLSSPSQTSNLEVRIVPLSIRDAFIEIANGSFQLDSFDYEERAPHMKALGAVATKIPTFRLFMPHDYDTLPLVRQQILKTVLYTPD